MCFVDPLIYAADDITFDKESNQLLRGSIRRSSKVVEMCQFSKGVCGKAVTITCNFKHKN